MTLEEKKEKMTVLVKEKLDSINYGVTSIVSYFVESSMLRDGSYKDIIITSFTEPLLGSSTSVISDYETLEMLYLRTGPMNFVEIADFFELED